MVLKELILNSFYIGGCDGLERTDFEQFLFWEGVVVLKELILNSFYFVKVWWSWNNIWEMHREALGTYKGVFKHMGVLGHQGISGNAQMHGGIQTYGGVQMPPNILGCQLNAPKCRTYMPLKKIRGVWTYGGVEMDREALGIYKGVLNIWGVGVIRMVSGCMGASKHMGCVQMPPDIWGCQVNALKRSDFEQFVLWEGVVVLKELILNSFYFGRVWWSWKNWFWTVSIWEGIMVLK